MSKEVQEEYWKQSKDSKSYWNLCVPNHPDLGIVWVVIKPSPDLRGIEHWYFTETECTNFGTRRNAQKFKKMLEAEDPVLTFEIIKVPKDV